MKRRAEDRHKRFLQSGFFPPELPPPFVSHDWGEKRRELLTAIRNKQGTHSVPAVVKIEVLSTLPERLSIPRFARSDRKIAIINPLNYLFISELIANRWNEISKILRASKISISKPVFDWDGDTVFLKPDFNQRNQRLSELSINNRHILFSDIARFYNSIYTHSIPWAVHGKAVAKANKGYSLWGNELDRLMRNAQDRQTIGIPVGPETSRIVAELVACAIDVELAKHIKGAKTRALRFVDDYAIGVESLDEVEQAKASLRRCLHNYELEINDEKTFSKEVLHLEYASWRQRIRNSVPSSHAAAGQWHSYFDLVREHGV